MQKKSFGILLFSSLALVHSGCATPPDVPICVEITMDRGRCVKIVSGEEITIDEKNKFEGKTWWEIRPAMVQVPASSWAEIKAFIIKVCKKTNQCQKEIASWDRSIQSIDSELKNKTETAR